MTAIFLSLHGTRVARDETGLFKWGTQIGAGPYEGTGDPVTNCACLTRDAPTLNVNVDIKIPHGVGNLEWLEHYHPSCFTTKIILQSQIIDHDISLALF